MLFIFLTLATFLIQVAGRYANVIKNGKLMYRKYY